MFKMSLLFLYLTRGLLTSFSNPVISTLCLEAFLRLLSTSSSSNFFLFIEREELRRGVPRPCRAIGPAAFVLRPVGREMVAGGFGKDVVGKEAIIKSKQN